MDKYTKSKALLNALKEERKNGNFVFTLKWIKEIMDNLPAADVVEVKHGEWIIKCDDYDCELMCCSICESEFYDGDNDTVDNLHNFCPHCGAKMDKKEGAEE